MRSLAADGIGLAARTSRGARTNHWTVLGQMVESSTEPTKMQSAATIFPSGYGAGPATRCAGAAKRALVQHANEYQDVSAGFTSALGFFQTSNIRSEHTAREVSVVSEEERDSELRAGDGSARGVRPRAQSRVSLLDV